MGLLSVLWLVLGGGIGALALAARLRPTSWERRGWLGLVGVSALAALLGGWLGTLLLGRLFGTLTALWVAILVVVLVWLLARLRTRTQAREQDEQ